MSDSPENAFLAGRQGLDPPSHSQYRSEYDRGALERQRSFQDPSHPASSGAGGSQVGTGGGGIFGIFGIAILLLIGILLMIAVGSAVVAAISAVVAAPLIVAATRLLSRRAKLSLGGGYRVAFVGLFLYFGITAALGGGLCWVGKGNTQLVFLRELFEAVGYFWNGAWLKGLNAMGGGSTPLIGVSRRPDPSLVLLGLVLTNGPGVIACAIALRKLIGGPYEGPLGFPKALGVTLLTVGASFAGTVWGLMFLASRVSLADLGQTTLAFAGTAAAALTFTYALVGGLVASFGLRLYCPIDGTGSMTFAGLYRRAFLALFLYGALTMLSFFLFRNADRLLEWAQQLSFSSRPLLAVRQTRATLRLALWESLPLHIPGVLAAGAVLIKTLGAFPARFVDYLKGYGLAVAVALPTFIPFLCVAMRLVRLGQALWR